MYFIVIKFLVISRKSPWRAHPLTALLALLPYVVSIFIG